MPWESLKVVFRKAWSCYRKLEDRQSGKTKYRERGNRAFVFVLYPEGLARHLDASRQKLTPHCLAAIFDSQLPSPNSLLKCLPNCLSPTIEDIFSSFKIAPVVRVIARQVSGKNCLAAIFASRHQDASPGPLGSQDNIWGSEMPFKTVFLRPQKLVPTKTLLLKHYDRRQGNTSNGNTASENWARAKIHLKKISTHFPTMFLLTPCAEISQHKKINN